MPASIIATQITARDLLPGDLFSNIGPEYWAVALSSGSVGERVYIRTNEPADDFPNADSLVYKITIVT